MKMKTLFLLPILLLSLISTSCWGENVSHLDLVERDGLTYKKFSDTPFTGEKIHNYVMTGNLLLKENFKNGKKIKSVMYWENGQLWEKGSYKNGKKHGEWVGYIDNGTVNPITTGTYENGEKTSCSMFCD
jgi:antitoxin component YwqK of YwqJK toxin-antitoxin module